MKESGRGLVGERTPYKIHIFTDEERPALASQNKEVRQSLLFSCFHALAVLFCRSVLAQVPSGSVWSSVNRKQTPRALACVVLPVLQ